VRYENILLGFLMPKKEKDSQNFDHLLSRYMIKYNYHVR